MNLSSNQMAVYSDKFSTEKMVEDELIRMKDRTDFPKYSKLKLEYVGSYKYPYVLVTPMGYLNVIFNDFSHLLSMVSDRNLKRRIFIKFG